MWSTKQKYLIHQYARAASLPDAEYRSVLEQATGRRTAAHRELDCRDFETAMAAMEARWERAIEEGLASRPPAKDMRYWRRQCGDHATTRQLRLIGALWSDLRVRTQPQDPVAYLAGIVHQAIGRPEPLLSLQIHEAGALIEALKSRKAVFDVE
jgi:hypothetical protein